MSRINGEALLEVAIFGAIIIMLLGVLINYGLRYNYQQKAMQQAFRKSLNKAVVEPGVSISNVMISDEHIPNPSDTFGIGSATPFTGSAGGVVRDYQMVETASDESALPRITLNINGEEFNYTTAGFRDEQNVPEESLDRYKEIYGSGNVWETGEGECRDEEESNDPNTGVLIITCNKPTKNIRIIDSCTGEIIDYGTAVKQCRMIVDSAACEKECERGNKSVTDSENEQDCETICGQTMNVPWYCAGYTETDTVNHAYNFPFLEQLFVSSALKTMGLQPDYEQSAVTDNSLRKVETASGITTTDNVDWNTTTTRKIITKPYGSTSGDTVTKEVSPGEVSQKKTEESRTTNW